MKLVDADGIADFAFLSPGIVGENDNKVDRLFQLVKNLLPGEPQQGRTSTRITGLKLS